VFAWVLEMRGNDLGGGTYDDEWYKLLEEDI
jgi:hypothetical protein